MFRVGRVLATFAVASMVMLTVVDLAEARRGGSSFGSRGTRTFSAPPVTRTAPAGRPSGAVHASTNASSRQAS